MLTCILVALSPILCRSLALELGAASGWEPANFFFIFSLPDVWFFRVREPSCVLSAALGSIWSLRLARLHNTQGDARDTDGDDAEDGEAEEKGYHHYDDVHGDDDCEGGSRGVVAPSLSLCHLPGNIGVGIITNTISTGFVIVCFSTRKDALFPYSNLHHYAGPGIMPSVRPSSPNSLTLSLPSCESRP